MRGRRAGKHDGAKEGEGSRFDRFRVLVARIAMVAGNMQQVNSGLRTCAGMRARMCVRARAFTVPTNNNDDDIADDRLSLGRA